MLSHKYHDKEETTEWLRGFLHALLCVTFGEVEAPLLTRTKGRRTLLRRSGPSLKRPGRTSIIHRFFENVIAMAKKLP